MSVAHSGRFRPDIEGLRGLAVLAVLAFHFQVPGFTGGFVGVDVFFVISGFVVTSMIAAKLDVGTFTFSDFYARRAKRILPALFTTIAATLVLGVLLLNTTHLSSLAASALASASGVPNIFFWRTSGYFSLDAEYIPLLHLWSIGVELQFYLLWPLVICAIHTRKPAIWIASICVASFMAGWLLDGRQSLVFYNTPFRIFEFAAGALLIYLPKWRGGRSNILFAMALAALTFTVLRIGTDARFPTQSGLLPTAAAASLIYSGQSGIGLMTLANRPIRFLGRISYSLYLTHWPIVVFWLYAIYRPPTVLDWVLIASASVCAATVLHFTIENPLRRSRKHIIRTALPAPVLALAAVAIMVFGGFPQRISDDIFSNATGGYEGCPYPQCAHPDSSNDIQLVVIGDSHARHLYAGLISYSETHDLGFAILHYDPWCSPVTGQQEDRDYDCASRLAGQSAFISEIGPEKALLAPRWAGRKEVEGQAAASRLHELTNLDHDSIGIVLNVPEWFQNRQPAGCAIPELIIESAARCAAIARADPFYVEREAINARLAASYEWGLVTDPFKALCTATECAQISDGNPIYSDGHHLTATGSIILMNETRDELANWLLDK